MIRNVVVGRVRAGVDPAEVQAALEAIRDLPVLRELGATAVVGPDLGLRDGNGSFAITVDLADEDAYRRYDADPEHERVRREMFGPLLDDVTRVQLQLTG